MKNRLEEIRKERGIKQEELIDGVELGGVGTYLGDAEDSNVNLFI